MDPEERRKRMQERMASMTPEEREQFLQRMKERGIDPATLQGGGPGQQAGAGPQGAAGAPGGAPRAAGVKARRVLVRLAPGAPAATSEVLARLAASAPVAWARPRPSTRCSDRCR